MDKTLLRISQRLKALADTGLLYAENPYDQERYAELRELSLELLEAGSDHSLEQLKSVFPLVTDYPTVKVDLRAMVLNGDQKILMVRESMDGKWSLPGGWADIGFSAKEAIVKECKEEAGIDVSVNRLLAVFDKKMHPHPPEPVYAYKMVFYCEPLTHELTRGFDILDVGYFDWQELPPLSENRILGYQINMLYQKILTEDLEPEVD